MNEKLIENAKLIIEKNGKCGSVWCAECPSNDGYRCVAVDYNGYETDKGPKIEWFKKWLEKNEEKRKPIFENKEHFGKFFDDCFTSDKEFYEKSEKRAIEKGYLFNSELEQSVAEAKDLINEFILKNDDLEVITRLGKIKKVLRSLESSYLELKK